MGMLGGGNDHRIEVIDLLVEIAKVGIGAGTFAPWETSGSIEVFLIYIAKGNHLLVSASRYVSATAPPYPDQTDCQLAIGRLGLSDGRETQNGGGYGCPLDKGTAT